ncbi:MAG: hypothetical protein AAGD07_03805 [Planctomycetota bacterium]
MSFAAAPLNPNVISTTESEETDGLPMTPQYLMFNAIQMLGPAAVLALAVTAMIAARKRPAVWSIAYCFTACLLVVGIVANHLAFSWFGTQSLTDDGGVITRYEPTLRFIGLAAQFVGFTACFIGSFSAIRALAKARPNVGDAEPCSDRVRSPD